MHGVTESYTTEQLHFHFSLSCIAEGNGNPFQCFCLENPRDGGAWWAAVYGVAQSRTRLKRLSSNSSSVYILILNSSFLFANYKLVFYVYVDIWYGQALVYRLLCPRNFPGKSTGVGCHFLFQGVFLTQGSDPGIEPRSPALQADTLPSEPPGKPCLQNRYYLICCLIVPASIRTWKKY